MAPKSIKLYYFNARGRAELCRLVLAAGGAKYEDIRVEGPKWPELKPSAPFGQMPFLDIDGNKFGQSVAMATYLAREFGLHGKTNLESLMVDQVVQLVQDFFSKVIQAMFEKDEAKKAELIKNVKEVEAPKFLGFFENLLKQNKTGFFVGSTMTLADIAVYDFMFGMVKRGMVDLDKFPQVQALYKKVESQDKIKAYLATRPDTEN